MTTHNCGKTVVQLAILEYTNGQRHTFASSARRAAAVAAAVAAAARLYVSITRSMLPPVFAQSPTFLAGDLSVTKRYGSTTLGGKWDTVRTPQIAAKRGAFPSAPSATLLSLHLPPDPFSAVVRLLYVPHARQALSSLRCPPVSCALVVFVSPACGLRVYHLSS